MSINILGSGYVGLTLGIYIANQGAKVNMIDIDESKINKLKSGKSPVHEIGIQEALDFAIQMLNSKGSFVSKLFMGSSFNEIVASAKKNFKEVHIFKPPSSRKDSKENFIICKNLR